MEEKAVYRRDEGSISNFDLVMLMKNDADDTFTKSCGIFYQRYCNYVFRKSATVCSKFNSANGFADDLTQEIFLIAFKAIKKFSFKPETPEAEHEYVLKAWLGQIGNYTFLKKFSSKPTHTISNSIENFHVQELDDQFCPLCDEFLIEDNTMLKCPRGHYKTPIADIISELAEPTLDLFEDIYGKMEVDVPNDFRIKLEKAMESLSEREKTTILKYASEFCIGTGRHISDEALEELCQLYSTTADNIKHIKQRALKKLRAICFS